MSFPSDLVGLTLSQTAQLSSAPFLSADLDLESPWKLTSVSLIIVLLSGRGGAGPSGSA